MLPGNRKLVRTTGFDRTTSDAQESGLELTDGELLPVSAANEARVKYNRALDRLEVSTDAGAYAALLTGGASGAPVVSVLTVAALRAVVSDTFIPAQLARVFDAALYEWDAASVEADDGNQVVRPNDVAPADPGRWKRVNLGEPSPIVFVAGSEQVLTIVDTLIGADSFDPTDFEDATFTFVAVLRSAGGVVDAELVLYNRTDNVVVGADPILSSNSQNPDRQSIALTTPADLPAGLRAYEVWLRQSVASSDPVICDKCELQIAW